MENMNIKTSDILTILFSLGVNYPRLKSLGLGFNHPIACISQSGEQTENIIQNLATFSPIKQISVCTTPKQCEKMLATANSEYVFIHYSKQPQLKKELDIIIYATESGFIGEDICKTIPFIFFSPEIPNELKETCFLIYLPDDRVDCPDSKDERLKQIISPIHEQYPIIQEYIEHLDCASPLEKTLKCAVYFLYPYFKTIYDNPGEYLNYYLNICEYLVSMDNEAKTSCGISDYFVKLVYEWINNDSESNIYATTMLIENSAQDYMLYDKDFLYLPEAIFEKIVKPLKKMQSGPLIKQTLKNDGILICDQSKTYSSKVMTYNIYGFSKRVRALKFRMNAMNQLGEIPLLELCKAYAKEEEIL